MLIPQIDEHRKYLSDNGRVAAFAEAVAESVRPGDVVVDLGAGTGILGLLACRAGAARVYSIEETGMIEVARAICRANGFDDRVVFLNENSERVQLPERADAVVSDQIGFFGFDAGVVRFFSDARERFLKPGGRLIPGRLELRVAAVERPDMAARVAFWERPTAGFDLSPARNWAVNTSYVPVFSEKDLISCPVAAASIDLHAPVPAYIGVAVSSRVTRRGALHGIGGWFVAELSPSVALSNWVGSHYAVDRWNVFFPIDRAIEVAEGDTVRIAMDVLHAESIVSWTVTVIDGAHGGAAAKGRYVHSMFQGMLVSREMVKRTKPDFAPRLTAIGAARRAVLALCDGAVPLNQIVRDIQEQHSVVFRSAEQAGRFVAEVIADNAR